MHAMSYMLTTKQDDLGSDMVAINQDVVLRDPATGLTHASFDHMTETATGLPAGAALCGEQIDPQTVLTTVSARITCESCGAALERRGYAVQMPADSAVELDEFMTAKGHKHHADPAATDTNTDGDTELEVQIAIGCWPNKAQAISLSIVLNGTRKHRPRLLFDPDDMPMIQWLGLPGIELIADQNGGLDIWVSGEPTDNTGLTPEQAISLIEKLISTTAAQPN